MPSDRKRLLTKLSQSYILGGSPCSGKSTIAEHLTDKFKFHYFKVDDHTSEYIERCNAQDQPTMAMFSKLSWNEIWSKPVEVQLSDEICFYHELFPFILDDLASISTDRPVLMEGAAFLPELLDPRIVDPKRVLFMVPTPEFQISNYRNRPWILPILSSCDDPEFAFNQWMKRDELFGKEVAQQARQQDYRVIEVDGSVSINDQFQQIIHLLGLE